MLSNQGGIGGVNFTPIVYWPQVAILGASRAVERPLYVGREARSSAGWSCRSRSPTTTA